MTRNTGNTPIEPHTEYARGRVQCPGCGVTVPVVPDPEGTSACVNCRDVSGP